MSQDPRKSFSGLQRSSPEVKSYPTISITTPPVGIVDEETRETAANPEASERLQKLNARGLNPLKPVILANTEFVPVGDGQDPDSVGLKAQIGENNLLSVNSVTKLFEIHRQIRKATIASAEHLINRIKGIDSEKLEEINKSISENFSDLIDEDLSKTVDAAIEMLSSSAKIKKPISFKTEKQGESSFPANSGRLVKSGSITISKRPIIQDLKLKNDAFMRGYIEFIILEKISFNIIKYMSGILSLKDAAAQSWSLYEALSFSSTGEGSTGGALSKMLALQLNGIDDIGELFEFAADPAADVTKALTGIVPSSSTPDISLFLQFFISAAESLLRQHESMTEAVELERDEQRYSVAQYPVYAQNTHSYDALQYLSKKGQQRLYHNYKYHKEDFDFIESSYHSAVNLQEALKKGNVENLYDYYPDDLDEIDIHGEMLASSLFDDCISIAAHSAPTTEKNRTFRILREGIPTIQNIEDFYSSLVGFNKKRDTAVYGHDFKYSLTYTRSPMVKYVANKTSNSEDLSDHIPLESTENIPDDIYNDAYLTGPEYFYDVAIQRGDTRLRDFEKFAKNHQKVAMAYVEDVYAMTKLDYLLPVARRILKDIGEELKAAANDGENSRSIFLLAMLTWKGQTIEGILDLMKSIYPGSFLNKHANDDSGKEGIGSGRENYVPESLPTPGIASHTHNYVQEGNRRATRVAANSLISEFLTKVGNVDGDKIKKEKSNKHLDHAGAKLKKNIQGNKYTDKDQEFGVIGRTWVNKVNDVATADKVRYKIKKASGQHATGLTKEMFNLDTGAGFRFNATAPNLTIRKYLHNYYFQEAGMVTAAQLINFNKNRPPKYKNSAGEDVETFANSGRYTAGLCYQGTSNELALHHRLFLLYSYVAKIFSKSAELFAESTHGDKGGKDAVIKLIMDRNEILGIAQAFIDVGNSEADRTISGHESKEIAYNNTIEHLDRFIFTLMKKTSRVGAYTAAPLLQANRLIEQYKTARSFIREGDGTDETKLAISTIKDRKINVYKNSLSLLTDEAISQMYKSYVASLKRSEGKAYTREDVPHLSQMRLMMKILTTSGYGLLSSEKIGPKNICHVGITNSLLSTLRLEAFKEFDNREFLESRRFCVNVFKRNEIDSQLLVYPKTFMFDSALMIIDSDNESNDLNHIANYADSWSFDDIINNIEFTTVNTGRFSSSGDPFEALTSALQIIYTKGSDLLAEGVEKDLLINHVLDYAFKIYYRYALGIDMNEGTFTLNPIRKNSGKVKGGLTTDPVRIQSNYEDLINQTIQLYPAANVDQKLASELFRAIEIIAEHPGYCGIDKLRRVLYPKKFDKVLSILVNEKDFVLYTDAYSKQFEDVYKTTPNFSYTSRISRPETVSAESVPVTDSQSPAGMLSANPVFKHIREVNEDYPEVFSTFVTITILP